MATGAKPLIEHWGIGMSSGLVYMFCCSRTDFRSPLEQCANTKPSNTGTRPPIRANRDGWMSVDVIEVYWQLI